MRFLGVLLCLSLSGCCCGMATGVKVPPVRQNSFQSPGARTGFGTPELTHEQIEAQRADAARQEALRAEQARKEAEKKAWAEGKINPPPEDVIPPSEGTIPVSPDLTPTPLPVEPAPTAP